MTLALALAGGMQRLKRLVAAPKRQTLNFKP